MMKPVLNALRAVPWRAVLVAQSLGAVFALEDWLQQLHEPTQPSLAVGLLCQSGTAWIVLMAALACDETVRRGVPVWRAFTIAVLSASGINVIAQWVIAPGGYHQGSAVLTTINNFFAVGGLWGTGLLVYVNRRSAQRLLARIRAGELARVHAEQRLTASRFAVAEAQVDPAAVLRELAETRDLYASGHAGADERLEALIARLRNSVGRGVPAADGGVP